MFAELNHWVGLDIRSCPDMLYLKIGASVHADKCSTEGPDCGAVLLVSSPVYTWRSTACLCCKVNLTSTNAPAV